MTTNDFFTEQTEQSIVKAAIVSKYFEVWAKVITSTQKKYPMYDSGQILYIDLFAGPGRYANGAASTPKLILEKAIQDDMIANKLVAIFNDKDEANVKSLEKCIKEIKGIKKLKYKPMVKNNEVGSKIVQMFESIRLAPTFFFVDPWGYKGLSLRLVNSVIKDWGCDCVFFFNYNRINMGLSNELVQEHMGALFGEERLTLLNKKLKRKKSNERELIIVEELCQSLKSYGSRYTLPFRFKNASGTRTQHHLIFVSKHFKGYELMKDIMAKESSDENQGVATFEYNPADKMPKQSLLFKLTLSVDDLAKILVTDYSGKKMPMRGIYEEHSIDTPFTVRNYKDALLKLEEEGKITTSPHRKNTMGDNVEIFFKRKKK